MTMLHEKSRAAAPNRTGGRMRRTSFMGGSVSVRIATEITSRTPVGLQLREKFLARSSRNLAQRMKK